MKSENMGHTPAPWKCFLMDDTEKGKVFGVNGWEDRCGIRGDVRLAEVYSYEANANLVAAAPELLETCKALCKKLVSVFNCEHTTAKCDCAISKIIQTADGVIAKAEGRK